MVDAMQRRQTKVDAMQRGQSTLLDSLDTDEGTQQRQLRKRLQRHCEQL